MQGIVGQLSDAKARESQAHLATRADRRSNHSKLMTIDGKPTLVSMMSINGCYICHKSEFEITDGKFGEKCSSSTAFKAAYEDGSALPPLPRGETKDYMAPKNV
jgi:hypothetical protein